MYTGMSHIRFAGEPYLSTNVPALPPLKMKPFGKYKRKPSTHNIISSNTGSLVTSSKSKSKVSINSTTKEKDKKGKKSKNKKPLVEGDAVVVQLDEPENTIGSVLDQNANSIEPFDEQISKDIALAVAMIVAEHEMMKLKYPGKYDVDEEGGKGAGADENKPESSKEKTGKSKNPKGSASRSREKLEKAEESKQQNEEGKESVQQTDTSQEIAIQTVDTTLTTKEKGVGHREKSKSRSPSRSREISSSAQKPVDVDSSNAANDNSSSIAALPPAVKRRPSSKKLPAKNESSMTFTVPSRTTTAAITPMLSASIASVDNSQVVSNAPMPTLGARMGGQLEVLRFLGRIQNYLNRLGYHRLGEPGIRINTRLSMKMQMVTAREIIQLAMPIKCLHAVVLAVYFTNCLDTVERFPIYFRSHVSSKEYKHIVLGIYVQGHFGALGISRDGGLQDKPTSYSKLSDLIFEFAKCYGQSGHILNEVKFGNLITHDQHSLERLFNKNYVVPIVGCLHSDIERNVEKFAKQLRAKMGLACIKSLRVDSSVQSRFSRSKTSLNANSSGVSLAVAGSDRSSTSVRIRALSMGPILSSRGSHNSSNNNNKNEDTSRRSSKTTMTRSKPAKLTKRK